MTSSTWISEGPAPLLSCGVDIEDSRRFEEIAREPGRPMPFIFTERELELARRLEHPAVQLCAAFCCKEALRKALGAPCDFAACELLWPLGDGEGSLELAPSLAAEHGIGAARARIDGDPGEPTELIAAVYLFQK